jgi:transcriptional regulator with XRE-family HTH domain
LAKPFRDLRKKLSPIAQEKATIKTHDMLKAMSLYELRQARNLSQEELAAKLNTKQSSISRIEKQTDMYISTLRKYIESLGGELNITAIFSEEKISINQFDAIGRNDKVGE